MMNGRSEARPWRFAPVLAAAMLLPGVLAPGNAGAAAPAPAKVKVAKVRDAKVEDTKVQDAKVQADQSGDAAASAPGPAEAAAPSTAEYLRVVSEPDRLVALEVACRRFVPRDGEGPTVGLVGVVHIGDRDYYRALQRRLDAYDVVLFESVKPAGTGGPARPGESEAAQVARTHAALRYAAGNIELYRQRHGGDAPGDLAALRAFAAETGGERFDDLLAVALVDAWGHPLRYEPSVDRADPLDGTPYVLRSLGADGRAGGEGVDADLVADGAEAILPTGGETRIQAELAQALALAFQLDEIDYEGAGWRHSDMSMDELQRAMAARGSSFELVEGTLGGTSLPATIARVLLGLLRFADAFVGGTLSDTLKVLLIEMLADESLLEQSMEQLDAAFGEVIIRDRNAVVMEDLDVVRAEPGVETVAIFYGAGHMPDLETRLVQDLGYERADVAWLRAIEIDLTRSEVTEQDVQRLRRMVRMMMKQMEAQQRRKPRGERGAE